MPQEGIEPIDKTEDSTAKDSQFPSHSSALATAIAALAFLSGHIHRNRHPVLLKYCPWPIV